MNIMPILLILVLLYIAVFWKVFTKAGQPGWAVLVPIYNGLIICKIAKKPWWWLLLSCIPYVGIVFSIWLINRIAKAFGQSAAFTVGLVCLSFIFWPMLAYGDAEYNSELLD
jgi:hypothetical protein